MGDSSWTNKEPKARFWNYPNYSQAMMELAPGNYPDFNWLPIKRNDVDSMWIPPNMQAYVYSYPHFAIRDRYGLYDSGDYRDLDNPFIHIGRNDIDSMKLMRKYDWNTFLYKCCTGANDVNSQMCKNYWGKSNSGSCDAFMENWCKNHPKDDKCSCYGQKPNPNDPPEIKYLKANPACYSYKCNTVGYKPIGVRQIKCPDITICRQTLGADGDSNIMSNNVIIQDCSADFDHPDSQPKPTDSTSDKSSTKQDNIWDFFLNIPKKYLVLFLVLIIIIVISSDKDDTLINENPFKKSPTD